jgi:hypothetical protein
MLEIICRRFLQVSPTSGLGNLDRTIFSCRLKYLSKVDLVPTRTISYQIVFSMMNNTATVSGVYGDVVLSTWVLLHMSEVLTLTRRTGFLHRTPEDSRLVFVGSKMDSGCGHTGISLVFKEQRIAQNQYYELTFNKSMHFTRDMVTKYALRRS